MDTTEFLEYSISQGLNSIKTDEESKKYHEIKIQEIQIKIDEQKEVVKDLLIFKEQHRRFLESIN